MFLSLRLITLTLLTGAAAAPASADCRLWIPFDFARVDLHASSRALLDRVAARYPKSRYVIEGHADAPGSEFQNLVISRRRAEVVAGYLARRGVSGVASLSALAQTEMVQVVHGPSQANRHVNIYVSPCSEAALSGS